MPIWWEMFAAENNGPVTGRHKAQGELEREMWASVEGLLRTGEELTGQPR